MADTAPWLDVVEILGGRSVFGLGPGRATPERLTEGVRAGLAPASVLALTEVLDLTPGEVGALVEIPERTLARRLHQRRLEPDESDRVFRVGRLVARARDVIGPPTRTREWLKAPNRALGNVTPLSLLDTDLGTERVEAVLTRLEHGIVG